MIDQATPRRAPIEAILRPKMAERHHDTRTVPATGDLAPWIDYFWIVRWDLDSPFTSQVMPQPRIHFAEEGGTLNVYGVNPHHFHRTIDNRGHVIGAGLRPGAFRAFSNVHARSIQGREIPANDVFRTSYAWIPTSPDDSDETLIQAISDALLAQRPTLDPVAQECESLIAESDRDRAITRAEHLAQRANVSLRTLQRRFSMHVGISPKWAIQRSRILDAIAECHHHADIDWPDLAIELGFTDQAHFINAFRDAVGVSPAQYHISLAAEP